MRHPVGSATIRSLKVISPLPTTGHGVIQRHSPGLLLVRAVRLLQFLPILLMLPLQDLLADTSRELPGEAPRTCRLRSWRMVASASFSLLWPWNCDLGFETPMRFEHQHRWQMFIHTKMEP